MWPHRPVHRFHSLFVPGASGRGGHCGCLSPEEVQETQGRSVWKLCPDPSEALVSVQRDRPEQVLGRPARHTSSVFSGALQTVRAHKQGCALCSLTRRRLWSDWLPLGPQGSEMKVNVGTALLSDVLSSRRTAMGLCGRPWGYFIWASRKSAIRFQKNHTSGKQVWKQK